MKTKKLGLISAIVLAMVFLFALNASAAWYTCTVIAAGPGESGRTYIRLTDNSGSFTNRWFIASSTRAKEMFAAALTAMTNNQPVSVNVGSSAEFSTIYNFYVMP